MQTKNRINEHWDALSRDILSEEFINENALNLNWTLVLKNNSLSDITLEKNIDHLDFEMVSSYQRPGTEFLEKHINQLNTYRLIRNQNIPDQFFFDHLDRFDLSVLLEERKLDKTTLRVNWHLIRDNNVLNAKIINDYMSTMQMKEKLLNYIISIVRIIFAFILSSVLLCVTCLLLSRLLEAYNISHTFNIDFTSTDVMGVFLLAFPVLIFYIVSIDSFNNSLLRLSDVVFLFLSGKTGKLDYFISDEHLLSNVKNRKGGFKNENVKNPSN